MSHPDREPLLAALEELRHEAATLGAVLGSAMNADAIYQGADVSDAARVSVDGTGRVVDVEVTASWHRAVGPHRLAQAVESAVADALRRRAQAWAGAVEDHGVPDEHGNIPHHRPRPRDPQPDRPGDPAVPPHPQVTDASAVAFTGEMLTLVQQVEGALDQFTTTLAEQAGRDITGHGPERMATVTVRGGEVVAVALDERWLDRTGHRLIAAELKAAFDAAHNAADRDRAAALTSVGPINQLRAVTDDFGTVLARLGLGRT